MCDAFTCVTHSHVLRIHMCYAFTCVTHSHVWRIHMCDAFTCVTHSHVWRIHMCDACTCEVFKCDAYNVVNFASRKFFTNLQLKLLNDKHVIHLFLLFFLQFDLKPNKLERLSLATISSLVQNFKERCSLSKKQTFTCSTLRACSRLYKLDYAARLTKDKYSTLFVCCLV